MIVHIIIVYVICCVTFFIVHLIKKQVRKSTQPPDFSGGYPIIGHAWKMMGDRKHIFNITKAMSREAMKNGGAVTVRIGPNVMYCLSDPDDCLQIANECLEKDLYYSFAKPFLGNGLTVAEVPIWKKHRKVICPAFRQENLNRFLDVFNRQAKRLVNQFKQELGRPFNIDKYVRLNSLESICMTSFGADVSELDGAHHQYLGAVNEILDIFTERFQKFWLHNDTVYSWSNLKKRQDSCAEKIMTFSKVILAKRKAEMNSNSSNEAGRGNYDPFMRFLLEISKETGSYSEKDILYETNTMVGAGYDTSTVTITLVLMILGTYQKVQMKVYEELQEVFKNSHRDLEKDDLLKLNYLDAVIKETLRLYPIAPLVARRLDRDIRIKNYTLKSGNGVALLFWAMHRHPVWGADAEVFRPDRWLDGSLPSNLIFGGFSLGKRACVGKTYAMMSIKTVISHVVRSYVIYADITKLQLEMHGALRATAGQIISIEERV